MNRSSSSSAIRWCVFGIFVALFATLAVSAVSPTSADAQATQNPTIDLVVSDAVAGQDFRTLAVAIDSGDAAMATISAEINYDANDISMDSASCAISEAGACNANGAGRVRVVMFTTTSFGENDQLMTVNFATAANASSSTVISFGALEVQDLQGAVIDLIQVAPIEIDLADAEVGSLTGDVVAASSQAGLYNLDVCAVHTVTNAEVCIPSSTRGTFRFDDLAIGSYQVTITDPASGYATATIDTSVDADSITTGLRAELAIATEADLADETVVSEAPGVLDQLETPAPGIAIDFGASISGRATDRATGSPVEGLIVCATQPQVLHQSCGSTDGNGEYTLTGLSGGNYWITSTDSLGLYQDVPVELVGVFDDTTAREGVRLILDRNAN